MKEQFFKWLNQLLVLNLFFVLACFLWFAIALVGRAIDIPLGFDLWYRLWEPVVQPALGILMAGAIISGISSWITNKLQRD